MKVGELCTRDTVFVKPEENISMVARLMDEYVVGSVVVIKDRKPVGIITDRDITIRVVASGKNPNEIKANEVMSGPLKIVKEDESIEDAIQRMRGAAIRRLPVIDGEGFLVGIITLDDLLDFLSEEIESMSRLIRWQQEKVEKEKGITP